VTSVDNRNVSDGYIVRADARENHLEATQSGIGK
jgi:hypothetical protein